MREAQETKETQRGRNCSKLPQKPFSPPANIRGRCFFMFFSILAEVPQNFFGVLVWLHVVICFLDIAFGIDKKGCSNDAVVFASHKLFFCPDVIKIGHFFMLIGKEREWKIMF